MLSTATIERVATAFASNANHKKNLIKYMQKKWFIPSSPVINNAPTRKKSSKLGNMRPTAFEKQPGMPISCFLNYVDDRIKGIIESATEWRHMSVSGGGVAGHWSDVRSPSEKAPGAIAFIKSFDADTFAFRQGKTRRGGYAAYMDIRHPQIKHFINIRNPTGGDPNAKALNIHHGVNITRNFYDAVSEGRPWQLIDPHTHEVVEEVDARELWLSILKTRTETGEPYIFNIDVANEALPQAQKEKGLRVNGSNLCSEITLPTASDRSAVCCLSSVNLALFDEWHDTGMIGDIVEMLDNVIEYFILNAPPELNRAINSAKAERAIGIGGTGFGTYLQKHMIAFDSAVGVGQSHKIWSTIKQQAVMRSIELGSSRGEAPDMKGTGRRNSHLLAIAPNSTTSRIIGVSPSCEPVNANIFVSNTMHGDIVYKNAELEAVLEAYGKNDKETWDSIKDNGGSVQHLSFLSHHHMEVFKTAMEIDQNWIIEHAMARQKYVCQAQSINLFFPPDASIEYIHTVHWRAQGLKSLYYYRSAQINSIGKVQRDFITDPSITCLSCEG